MFSPLVTLMAWVQSRTAHREDGIVAAEYILLGIGILVAVAAAALVFGGKITNKFGTLLP